MRLRAELLTRMGKPSCFLKGGIQAEKSQSADIEVTNQEMLQGTCTASRVGTAMKGGLSTLV